MVISNSLSSATLKTSCTKVFSPAIARCQWRRQSHQHRSNYPTRVGGNFCISPKSKTRVRDICRLLPLHQRTGVLVRHPPVEYLLRQLPPRNRPKAPRALSRQRDHHRDQCPTVSTLKEFFDEVRADFRNNNVNLIYGTVRIIERDDESVLPWARQASACVIFNLHTVHNPDGLQCSADAFRRLIEMAARQEGTYYLTYHRWATRKQVEDCYPRYPKFLQLKKKYDPEQRFQSDWYRHYTTMFGDQVLTEAKDQIFRDRRTRLVVAAESAPGCKHPNSDYIFSPTALPCVNKYK
jgi:hypothetical protein